MTKTLIPEGAPYFRYARFKSIYKNDVMSSETTVQEWLKEFIAHQGGIAGSVHYLRGDGLELAAQIRLPPPVVEKTRWIPKGKGMAGLAWERDRPVSTCNLKTDTTGDVRPGAKAVNANAALAIPVHDTGGALRGVVGLAFDSEREFSEEEMSAFQQAAETVPADG